MDGDIKSGEMEVFTKATGKKTRQTEKEDSSTLMETSMMVTGKMTKPMGMVAQDRSRQSFQETTKYEKLRSHRP